MELLLLAGTTFGFFVLLNTQKLG